VAGVRFLDRTTENPTNYVRGVTETQASPLEKIEGRRLFGDATAEEEQFQREERKMSDSMKIPDVRPRDFSPGGVGGGGGGGVVPAHSHPDSESVTARAEAMAFAYGGY
jgi:hypothetical protein